MLNNFVIIPLFWLSSFIGFSGFAGFSGEKTGVEAHIITSAEGNSYTFTGTVLNNSGNVVEFAYELKVSRKGQSGTSNSSQKGSSIVNPGKKSILSNSSVNIGETDSCVVTLHLRSANTIIAADTVKISGTGAIPEKNYNE